MNFNQPNDLSWCDGCKTYVDRNQLSSHRDQCQARQRRTQQQPQQPQQPNRMATIQTGPSQRTHAGIFTSVPQHRVSPAQPTQPSRPQQPETDVLCDYCQERYPIIILEAHINVCEAKQALLRFQMEEQQSSPTRQNRVVVQNRQSISNDGHEVQSLRPGQTIRTEQLLPDGRVKITQVSKDHNGNISTQTTISSNRPQQRVVANDMDEDNPLMMLNQLINARFQGPRMQQQQNRMVGPQQQEMQNFGQFVQLLMLRGAGHSHEEGLQDQEFKDLNQVNYRPTENLSEENKKCIICMTEYEPNEALKLLPCTHRFHAQCIEQWLKDHSKCPICKKDARTRN